MHDDDEMIMHDRDGGHHVKCTEIMIDDPEIVLDEPKSASMLNRFCPISALFTIFFWFVGFKNRLLKAQLITLQTFHRVVIFQLFYL